MENTENENKVTTENDYKVTTENENKIIPENNTKLTTENNTNKSPLLNKSNKKKSPHIKIVSPYKVSEFILDEISVRFLISLDPLDLKNIERFFFILEESHWFFIDNYKENPLPFQEFCVQILNHNNIKINVSEGLQKFKDYKQSIKVYGGILFDKSMESVLIVRENGKAGSFGFPKGKKSKDEDGMDCAIREVMEEIGYDVSNKILKRVSINLFEKMNFYFVFNLNRKTKFKSTMQNEITDISWLSIKKLEEGTLGKKFSIITKSYMLWRDMYTKIYSNRFKFDRNKFVDIICDINKKKQIN